MTDATANVDGELATGPSGLRRLAAIAALVLVLAVGLDTLVQVATQPVRVLAELLLLVVFLAAGWVAATRTGAHRVAAVAVAAATVVGLVVLVAGAERFAYISLLVGIVAIVVAVALARFALGATTGALHEGCDRRHASSGGRPWRTVHEPQVGRREG